MKSNAKKISKADLELLKKKLLEQQAFLRTCIKGELDTLLDQSFVSDDISQDVSSQDVIAGLGENAAIELANVQSALMRLSSPEFGICDICDKPIATARLKAIPYADTCLKCQSELEKSQ